jgi:hypothetical protein
MAREKAVRALLKRAAAMWTSTQRLAIALIASSMLCTLDREVAASIPRSTRAVGLMAAFSFPANVSIGSASSTAPRRPIWKARTGAGTNRSVSLS